MQQTRRALVAWLAALPASTASDKGQVLPSERRRFLDPATEFEIVRLTDASYSSYLPANYGRFVSRRGDFLLYSSDREGSLQAYRLDVKSGQSRLLTEARKLDRETLTLLPEERGFCWFDGDRLMTAGFGNLRERQVYTTPAGWERAQGFGVSDDGLYGVLVERKDNGSHLRLVHLLRDTVQTVVEAQGLMSAPIVRPKRAGILYRLDENAWLVNFDGKDNRRLRLAPGRTGPTLWSPDGRTVLYLNFPAEKGKLNALREHTPDTGADVLVSNTSQFVLFGRNSDASVFVGVSGSKASPHILLLVRSVKRELTLCEHRASDPLSVAPTFAPSSQRIFYQSDKHGKPAIYTMTVERFVEKTES